MKCCDKGGKTYKGSTFPGGHFKDGLFGSYKNSYYKELYCMERVIPDEDSKYAGQTVYFQSQSKVFGK